MKQLADAERTRLGRNGPRAPQERCNTATAVPKQDGRATKRPAVTSARLGLLRRLRHETAEHMRLMGEALHLLLGVTLLNL